MEFEEKIKAIKQCIKTLEKLPMRIGASVYVRIGKVGNYKMLNIESRELYEFMFRELLQKKNYLIDQRIWKSAVDYILGGYTLERMQQQKNRIGQIDNAIYYDLLDINSAKSHYVKITADDWKVVTGNLDNFEWNNFQLPQDVPDKGNSNIECIFDYVNIHEDDKLLFLVYLVACFIPDIQHPILNICGEAGTGKSTISKLIKDLVDPSNAPLNDFSDGEDGIRLPLSQNYLTIFDNVEKLPQKLNALFCRAVTGGETIKRKLYSNNEMISIPLKSIVVMNGITSAIRREDLMSRTVFIETQPISDCNRAGELWNSYRQNKKCILSWIFDVLAKAMRLVDNVRLSESYRMMEFAVWGYAIAEAIAENSGSKFLDAMKKNENIQLQETYANEPLITLISNYMTIRQNEEVCMSTTKFHDMIMKKADLYLGSDADSMKKLLPHTSATFAKKLNSLKSIFQKMGIIIEIDKTRDVRNISQILIYRESEWDTEKKPNDVAEMTTRHIIRVPITGIETPISLNSL